MAVRSWHPASGLAAPRVETRTAAGADETSARSLQFVTREYASVPVAATDKATAAEQAEPRPADIHVQLTRGAAQLSVRWPSAQAGACAAWLRELAAVALKD